MSSSTARLNDLIDAVAEGDRPALEELYRLTCAKLYGVALRILRRPELAEEALREAYLRIWQEAGTYDPRLTDPMIFVVAATRNAALALARKRGENNLHTAAAPADSGERRCRHSTAADERPAQAAACCTRRAFRGPAAHGVARLLRRL